ncbi:MAG TPA: hypothetical protein VFB22_06855 [Candidatus Baltobacteraceae bacterium]|nr:hypothetical protein [Candidatus Baltobacteraceae bacterium]
MPPRAIVPLSSPRSVTVHFSIALPARSSAGLRRRPRYVSASTKSATVTVTPAGGSPATPVVINCSPASCTGQLAAPVGSDTFAVKLFDAANGAGSLLSTGTLTQTIVLDAANVVKVTFDGVVRALALSLAPSAVTFGKASTVNVLAAALDADGNTIVGPGSYVDLNGDPLTIMLADSDASGATKLSVTALSAPPPTPVTLSYDGAAISCVTITASATALAPATALLPSTGTPTLYVARSTQIEAIANPATSPTVTRTIAGGATELGAGITAVATDACANVLAATNSSTPAQQVLVFAGTANGNAAPLRSFGDPNSSNPGAITVDASGRPTVAFDDGCGTIETFAATAGGASSPVRTVSTGCQGAIGLVYDDARNLWASNDCVYEVPPSATTTPNTPTLPGNIADELGAVTATTVDSRGDLYAASTVSSCDVLFQGVSLDILQFAPQSNGYPAPARVMSLGTNIVTVGSGENIIVGIGTDGTGTFYVAYQTEGGMHVYEYAAAPSTSVAPIAQFAFQTPSTILTGMAVAPNGTIFVSGANPDLTSGWVLTFAPGNTTGTADEMLSVGGYPWFVGATATALYVGLTPCCSQPEPYSVAVYAPAASGNATPLRTIALPSASSRMFGAVDPAGDVYAMPDTEPSTVQVVPAGATTPSRTFDVPLFAAAPSYDPTTGNLDIASSMTSGPDEDSLPASDVLDEIQAYATSSSGTASPAAQIRDGAPDAPPFMTAQLGRDAAGNIYVESAGDGSVRVYDPVTKQLVRSILGLPAVGPMAVDTDGTVYILGGAGVADANLDARRRSARLHTALRPIPAAAVPVAGSTPSGSDASADYGAILVYAPNASGLVAPAAVIPASVVGSQPVGLAIAH